MRGKFDITSTVGQFLALVRWRIDQSISLDLMVIMKEVALSATFTHAQDTRALRPPCWTYYTVEQVVKIFSEKNYCTSGYYLLCNLLLLAINFL